MQRRGSQALGETLVKVFPRPWSDLKKRIGFSKQYIKDVTYGRRSNSAIVAEAENLLRERFRELESLKEAALQIEAAA